jgi:hypothetical protein
MSWLRLRLATLRRNKERQSSITIAQTATWEKAPFQTSLISFVCITAKNASWGISTDPIASYASYLLSASLMNFSFTRGHTVAFAVTFLRNALTVSRDDFTTNCEARSATSNLFGAESIPRIRLTNSASMN